MFRARILVAIIVIFGLCFRAAAEDAPAPGLDVGSRFCTLVGEGEADPAQLLNRLDDFDCSPGRLAKATDFMWLAANVADISADFVDPQLVLRMSHHRDISVSVKYAGGEIVTNNYDIEALKKLWLAPSSMSFPISTEYGAPEMFLIGVTQPWDPLNFNNIELTSKARAEKSHLHGLMSALIFCGILITPIILNLVFYFLLKYRFMLTHSVMSAANLVYAAFWSGIIFIVFPSVDIVERSTIDHLFVAISVGAGTYLVRDLCDPETLGPRFRWALTISGPLPFIAAVGAMVIAPGMPYYASLIYHNVFFVPLIVSIAALGYAALSGSKLAMFQLVGWSGMIFYAFARVLRGLGLFESTEFLDMSFLPALVFETVATSLIVAVRIYSLHNDLQVASSELAEVRELADTDHLTGLLNRRAFSREFDARVFHPERREGCQAIFVIDLDHFKRVNDTLGHDAGDRALVQMSLLLEQQCREGDLCGRFGGEEFVLLMHAPTEKGILACAERLRRNVEANRFGDSHYPIGRLTVSVGVVFVAGDAPTTLTELCAIADEALYRSKHEGRNLITVAAPFEHYNRHFRPARKKVQMAEA